MTLVIGIAAIVAVLWALNVMGNNSASAAISPLMQAIATAEGGLINGSNNPGSLALGDQGAGVFNSAGVTIFSSLADGWTALSQFLSNLFSGASWYTPNMTLQQFANSYVNGPYGPLGINAQTAGSTNWANNVVVSLQAAGIAVTTDTPMSDIVSLAG